MTKQTQKNLHISIFIFLTGGQLLYNVVLVFCQTTAQISHNYTYMYIPSLLSFPAPAIPPIEVITGLP